MFFSSFHILWFRKVTLKSVMCYKQLFRWWRDPAGRHSEALGHWGCKCLPICFSVQKVGLHSMSTWRTQILFELREIGRVEGEIYWITRGSKMDNSVNGMWRIACYPLMQVGGNILKHGLHCKYSFPFCKQYPYPCPFMHCYVNIRLFWSLRLF